MYRKTIYDNNDRFNEAVKKVIELKNQGCQEEDITNKLSDIFQEKEIIELINNLNKIPQLNGNSIMKKTLKISLWILLIVKILLVPIMLIPIDTTLFWKLLIFTISLIIIVISLYLVYRESYETVFFIIFMSFVLSTDAFMNNIQTLFSISVLSFAWWIGLINILAFISSLYSSWKLKKIYSDRLIKLKNLIKKENLSYL